MKLIIDIPEDIQNTIEADEFISREQLAVLQMHILNGIPLDDLKEIYIGMDGNAVQIYPNNEVLDKIRAELHATAEMHDDGDYYLRDEWIDEIFDKYRNEVSYEVS